MLLIDIKTVKLLLPSIKMGKEMRSWTISLERYKQSKVFKLRKFLSKNLQVSKI
jgi:hypothetical protein